MILKRFMTPLMGLATVALVAGGMVAAAPAAQAAVIGSLVFPTSGTDALPFDVNTSGACTAGTYIQIKMYGSGFPTDGLRVTPNSPQSIYPINTQGGYTIAIQDTLKNFAAQQVPPATLTGKYDFVAYCKNALSGTSLADFTGSIWFTSPTRWQNTAPAVVRNTVRPTVTGVIKTGGAAVCNKGTWTGATTYRYAWLRNGVAIPGATAARRVLAPADFNKLISCRVTGVTGTTAVNAVSVAKKVAIGVKLRAVKAPSIVGAARVGVIQRAAVGTWAPKATSYKYVWKRNGKAIKGAIKATYKTVAVDKGKSLVVTVTAVSLGYANGVATSKAKRIV